MIENSNDANVWKKITATTPVKLKVHKIHDYWSCNIKVLIPLNKIKAHQVKHVRNNTWFSLINHSFGESRQKLFFKTDLILFKFIHTN